MFMMEIHQKALDNVTVVIRKYKDKCFHNLAPLLQDGRKSLCQMAHCWVKGENFCPAVQRPKSFCGTVSIKAPRGVQMWNLIYIDVGTVVEEGNNHTLAGVIGSWPVRKQYHGSGKGPSNNYNAWQGSLWPTIGPWWQPPHQLDSQHSDQWVFRSLSGVGKITILCQPLITILCQPLGWFQVSPLVDGTIPND